MAALLTAMSIMAIALAAALPAWPISIAANWWQRRAGWNAGGSRSRRSQHTGCE
jgi:hypothetical protein